MFFSTQELPGGSSGHMVQSDQLTRRHTFTWIGFQIRDVGSSFAAGQLPEVEVSFDYSKLIIGF